VTHCFDISQQFHTPLATQKTIGSYHASREQLRMKRFLRWLDVKHPDVAGPLDLRQRHVHEYRVWLENHGPEDAVNASGANVRTGSSCSPQTVWSYLLPIKALDVFRERLSSPLPFSPYDGNLTAKMLGAGETSEENTTEPLPDEVIATLIDCARRYIEHYAPTVLAMREEMQRSPPNCRPVRSHADGYYRCRFQVSTFSIYDTTPDY